MHHRSATSTFHLSALSLVGQGCARLRQSRKMSSLHISALLVARLILSLGGVLSNGFIVIVVIKEWAECRRLASIDQLLLSLGLSNFSASIIETIYYLSRLWTRMLSFLFPQMYFFSFVAVMSTFWFTAWLCMFYCIKIVNSTHPLFTQCKQRISWLIPRLIVGSLVLSVFISLFILENVFKETQLNTPINATNAIKGWTPYGFAWNSGVIILAVGSGCPLLIVFICSVLVVASLCKHICRMTDEESSSRSFQMEGHIKAARTVLSILFIYISFQVAHSLNGIVVTTENGDLFLTTVMAAYAPAQASILLMSNPKLKQAAARILRRTRS